MIKRILIVLILCCLYTISYAQDAQWEQRVIKGIREHYSRIPADSIFVSVEKVVNAPDRDGECLHIKVSFTLHKGEENEEVHFKNYWVDYSKNEYYYISDIRKKTPKGSKVPLPYQWWTSTTYWSSAKNAEIVQQIISNYTNGE